LTFYKAGFFSGESIGLDTLYYALAVVGLMISSFIIRSFAQLIRQNNIGNLSFDWLKSLSNSLFDCCWLGPLILFVIPAVITSHGTTDIFMNTILIFGISVFYTFPVLLAAIIVGLVSRFNIFNSRRAQKILCSLLFVAIVIEDLYIHTLYNS
jgi:hypothetical protein